MNHSIEMEQLDIPFALRTKLTISVLGVSLFLIIYEKLVCPLIDRLNLLPGPFNYAPLEKMFAAHPELMPRPRFTGDFDLGSIGHLLVLFVVFILLRKVIFFLGRKVPKNILMPRHAYRLSVLSWLLMGILAVTYFSTFYTNYPVPGLFKLLSGYWFLGAALVAQYEYIMHEREYRKSHRETSGPASFFEQLPRRISQITVLTASVPSIAMIATMYRYAFEEKLIPAAASYEVMFLLSILLFIGLWVAGSYGKTLRADTYSLVSVIRQIERGDYRVAHLPVLRADELGEVGRGVWEMAEGLEERETIREAFGHFVSPQVADEFIKYYASGTDDVRNSKRRKAVVMMCDLRSFTPLSESMPAEELTTLLNEYFNRMVKVIDAHNGLVDKFIGDAIMALFGVVGEPREACTKAVQAAELMQQELNALAKERNLPQLKAGIGIHTGELVMGYIGSEQRIEFTAIGEVVNLAARLESAAKAPNPPVIFSNAVKDELLGDLAGEVVKVGEAQLKGVSAVQELFSLKAMTGKMAQSQV